MKIFDYIQQFNVELHYKLSKQHIILDAFLRFVNSNIDIAFSKKKLNAFFITVLMKIEKNFR